jgi:peptidoglycan/LPS O-acetylase OafA/YrhL
MTYLKNFAATIAAVLLLIVILIVELSDSETGVKGIVWALVIVLLIAAVAFDLFRQKKLKLPSDLTP